MEFNRRLNSLRIASGYTLEELGKMIGVSKSAISNYETGYRYPKKEQLEALADIFNVDLDYLTGRSAIPNKYQESRRQSANSVIQSLDNLTSDEIRCINKIRALDSHGRQVVDFLLDAEFKRVQQIIAVSKGEAIVEGVGETIAVPLLRNALSAEKIPPGDIIGSVPVAATGQVAKGETDLFALKVTNESMAPRISTGDTVIVRKQDDVNSGEVAVVVLDGTTVVCKQVIKEGNTLRLVPLNGEFQTREFRRDDPKKRFKIIGRVIENIQAV